VSTPSPNLRPFADTTKQKNRDQGQMRSISVNRNRLWGRGIRVSSVAGHNGGSLATLFNGLADHPQSGWLRACRLFVAHHYARGLKLRARVYEGAIGLGLLTPQRNEYRRAVHVVANEESEVVEIQLPGGAALGALMLRNNRRCPVTSRAAPCRQPPRHFLPLKAHCRHFPSRHIGPSNNS
jgi:hypothetical protein